MKLGGIRWDSRSEPNPAWLDMDHSNENGNEINSRLDSQQTQTQKFNTIPDAVGRNRAPIELCSYRNHLVRLATMAHNSFN
jgi:hypothetical protein